MGLIVDDLIKQVFRILLEDSVAQNAGWTEVDFEEKIAFLEAYIDVDKLNRNKTKRHLE